MKFTPATPHGVISLGLVLAAAALGAWALFQTAWSLGLVYGVICAVGAAVIIYGYCAKCLCKAQCAHVLPGWVAQAFRRQPGPYTRLEVVALDLALGLIILFPQIALWRYPGWLILFWALLLVAGVQIRTQVCRACDNRYCPVSLKNRAGTP